MGYIGQTPSAVPLTSADIADGTITNDDLAGSITDAKLLALNASKLTGSLPASMATDLAPVRSDILKLAIHSGIDGNRAAFNLDDSFIDTFEDDTGITTETTVDRDATGEYVNSVTYTTSADWPYSADIDQEIYDGGGNMFLVPDGTDWQRIDVHTDRLGYWNNPSSYAEWFYIDYLAAYRWAGIKAAVYNSHAMVKTWRLEYSNDGSNWTYADLTGSTTSALSGFSLANDNNFSITNPSGGEITNVTNTGDDSYHGGIITFGTAFSARYLRVSIGTKIDNTNAYPAWASFIPIQQIPTVNATGTLISDPQTASTSRTSASGVIIYEDAAGTNTLGTDLKIYFSCNNSAWTEASSYGTATTYSGTKKLVKLGATTCTAGTSVAMKAVWASQVASIAAKTITINGQVQHDTAQKKFGTSSLIFDGTTDSLEIADHSDFSFGTGNFTIDFWMRTGGAWGLAHQCTGTASTSTFNMWLGGAGAQFYTTIYHSDGSNFNIGGGANLNDNVWHHLAVVRNGSAFNIYVDGTSTASSSTAAAMTDATRSIFIGDAVSAGSGDFNGHIEDFRISNTARWTSNFSVPTSAHATDANTLLLIGSNTTDGSTVITDATGVTGKEARLHGWAVNY